MGSTKFTGKAPTGTKQQRQSLEQMLEGLGPDVNQFLQQIMGGSSPEQMEEMFQKTIVDPTMLGYEQQTVPGIQQRFVDADAGSSSALNQALASSASDLSTKLGAQRGQFYQNQVGNQTNIMQMINQLLGMKQFDPIVTQSQGFLPAMGQAAQQAGTSAASMGGI